MENVLQASATDNITKQVYTSIQGTLFTQGYRVPCANPNLYLTLKFLNKKGNFNFL